ncbi:unnamed protein product [Symbiodinium pilosum]|uniref:Uncharacterized protein n=1 Tax=Symbiodinium pilosum TaxID=2952 RepID=A0A812MSV6_SYMPI|nr:unnamed protein product [Symbiodinium pilosum]
MRSNSGGGWACISRALCSFILLTDTYQDATFPVIANKCNFELWFVSAWLVGLGVGLMQVVVQLLVLAYMALQYKWATTPEERDRLLVQGAFTALRGSDNLVLVYAVRPAVEERLGGASSWAMKLSEARIAFLRFIFEDVEQSALQAVFLIFYDEAAFADKLWVTTSIATSLLLSFTIVVQCIPEVRDWLWYRQDVNLTVLQIASLEGRLTEQSRVNLKPRAIPSSCKGARRLPVDSAFADPVVRVGRPAVSLLGCDSNGLTTLLGLEAREKVVEDTITNSTIGTSWSPGVAIILSTVALASFASQLTRDVGNIKRQTLEKLESYLGSYSCCSFEEMRAVGEHDAKDGALLRPVVDSDDDLWLEVQAKARSEKWWAAPWLLIGEEGTWFTREEFNVALEVKLHKLEYLVRSIDSGASWLSASLPFYHRYLHYQMPKRLRSLVDLANSTGLDASTLTSVYQLRTNVSHALRIASVRQHVQQLLSNRHFVKAGLEKKSWWILDCPEAPPLRLIHWSKIAAAGQLPKYNVDSGGATSVEELLDEVEDAEQQKKHSMSTQICICYHHFDRLGVGRDAAERQLVVFLLSHRWLRTAGVQKGHPDSMENIKAISRFWGDLLSNEYVNGFPLCETLTPCLGSKTMKKNPLHLTAASVQPWRKTCPASSKQKSSVIESSCCVLEMPEVG